MPVISLRIPSEILDRLQKEAHARGVSRNARMVEVLNWWSQRDDDADASLWSRRHALADVLKLMDPTTLANNVGHQDPEVAAGAWAKILALADAGEPRCKVAVDVVLSPSSLEEGFRLVALSPEEQAVLAKWRARSRGQAS